MSFSLQKYFPNLFVALIVEAGFCRLFGRVVKNNQTLKTFETVFDNPSEDELESKIITYLKEKKKEYHNIYVSFFLNSIGQGAISAVSPREFKEHNINIMDVSYMSIDAKWSVYAGKTDVRWAKDLFSPLGLDLLYSPFILLYKCIKSNPQEEKPTLYIYNHEGSFAIGIYDKEEFLYGTFLKTYTVQTTFQEQIEEAKDWNEEEEIESQVDLDEIELDEIEDDYQLLDDLNDLEEGLDDEDFEELVGSEEVEEKEEEADKDTESSIALLGRDMTMYNFLVNAIKDFYENTLYKHTFIENIIIYNNHEIADAVVNMLEDELLMKVEIKKIKTLELMCDLAIEDIAL